MSTKGKLIHESMDQIFREARAGGYPSFDTIRVMLSKMYDAGALETPDDDAARWRMLVLHFGDLRARHVRDVPFFPKRLSLTPFEGNAATSFHCGCGAEWRFDCVWTEGTGSADTIPKFIDLMLAKQRNGEDE